MLEEVWIRQATPGTGTFYIVSGYGCYNGGVRFYEVFRHHIECGGRVVAYFAGSTSQRLTSRQLVAQLLEVGVEVHIVNRKRQLHAKCYGSSSHEGERLVVTSGNFTGPGMGLNVEASVILDQSTTAGMGFRWETLTQQIVKQAWQRFLPTLDDQNSPAWRLLYDETPGGVTIDDSDETTMVLVLGHADTARIQADPGTNAGKGTQYFWLSKDCYGFFPPLTIRNQRGHKATFSCTVTMHYMDIQQTQTDCRVTFEAENNLDFRLGTGPLRYSKAAADGDLVTITRVGESEYEMRVFHQGTREFQLLRNHAVTYIGHRGKQYGYMDNDLFEQVIGTRLPSTDLTHAFQPNNRNAADE